MNILDKNFASYINFKQNSRIKDNNHITNKLQRDLSDFKMSDYIHPHDVSLIFVFHYWFDILIYDPIKKKQIWYLC